MPIKDKPNNRVRRCAQHVMDSGYDKGHAIATCQGSTDQGYQSGKDLGHKTPNSKIKKADYLAVFSAKSTT